MWQHPQLSKYSSVCTHWKKKNPGGIPHFPLSINNAREGGGEGMSLFFSSRFSSFPFLSLTFSFSLSRTHTRWYVPSARERPSSLRDHKDNTQHCPLPSKYDVFFYDQSTKSVLCRIPKEKKKKANDRRRSGTKTVKGHRSTFFFFIWKERRRCHFFFLQTWWRLMIPPPLF